MTIETHETREDYSAIEAAHAAAQQRIQDEHDAAVQAELKPALATAEFDMARADAERMRGVGDRRLRTGGAALAGLTGLAAVIAAASLWRKPEVIHDVKIVEQVKVEKIEVPQIVEVPKIVTETKVIEKPVEKIIEKPVDRIVYRDREKLQAPQQLSQPTDETPPANSIIPEAGERMSPEEFKGTPMFRSAQKCAGKLLSHINGELTFSDGTKCWDATAGGDVDSSITTSRHNGDLVVCNDTGHIFASGRPEKNCLALHKGRVENVRDITSGQRAHSSDPLSDLFN